MKFSDNRNQPRPGPWLCSSVTALLIAASGCASPRPPRPPSLDLPAIATDFTVQRAGNQVTLRWTTPDKTTDRLEVKGVITAEVCRIVYPVAHTSAPHTPGSAPPCVAIARFGVALGPSQSVDTLSAALAAEPATLLAYRVQLLNLHNRSAGFSAKAFAAAGAAPPPVERLRATSAPSGAMLEWEPQGNSASVELDRLLLTPSPAKPVASGASKPPTKSPPPPKPASLGKAGRTHSSAPKSPVPMPITLPEVKLHIPAEHTDPGGAIDSTAVKGETYRYTAERVRTVSLDGHTLTLRSFPSAPVTVAIRDTFPPAVPTGLEAVPSALTSSPRSIDLSWNSDSDADLTGYIVYRQDVTSTGDLTGPSTRLNQTPVPGPAYSDETTVPGRRYAYRVTAVDASGNESAPSADTQETLREP